MLRTHMARVHAFQFDLLAARRLTVVIALLFHVAHETSWPLPFFLAPSAFRTNKITWKVLLAFRTKSSILLLIPPASAKGTVS